MSDKRSALLKFDPKLNKLSKGKELRQGLSVVVQIGDTLWVTNDETISLERLSRSKGSPEGDSIHYNEHEQFALSEYLSLPVPPPSDPKDIEEADVEGLAYEAPYLWLVGSHSLKRKKPKKESSEEDFKRLAKVSSDGNRYLLARIPCLERDGTYTLENPTDYRGEKVTASRLRGGAEGNDLTAALAQDKLLKQFLTIPGKDNGFDIEGLAVRDDHVFLGLRGPVLRGWAVVLELRLEANEENPSELTMKSIDPNNPSYPLYRKHFLDLGGLGIRDLCRDGSDLLILAGPTMDLDGPVTIFRWKEGTRPESERLVYGEVLQEEIRNVPYGQGEDHAEGMTLFAPDGGEARHVLVVYDSASEGRQKENSTVADIFPLRGVSG